MLERGADGDSSIVRGSGPVVCIAGGPSLTQQQCDYVRGKARVIAINNAYLLAPWANVCYFPDLKFFDWHSKGHPGIAVKSMGLSAQDVARRFAEFAGNKCSLDVNRLERPVHLLKYVRELAWSDDSRKIGRGEYGHAGLQALQMAALAGGDPIILLGYDAHDRHVRERPHWFGDHPIATPRSVPAKCRRSYIAAEPEIKKRGLRIWNCSPDTAIDVFPKMTLEEAFAACAEPAAA